jgi:transposase
MLGCAASWQDERLLRRPIRKKIVEAVEKRGMPKIEAAKTFGVGISSVKRYVATYREGRSLAPKKRPGSKPKLDEGARRLLESDLEERPAAHAATERREYLRTVCGVEVSDSTLSRMLPRNWGANVTLLASMSLSGIGSSLAVGGCNHEGRLRGLCGAGPCSRTEAGADSGDGQPLFSQRFSG